MKRSSSTALALTAAFAASIAAATPARALEPKQCLPISEMNAALKADGQRTLIIGDRKALHDPTGRAEDISVTRYANAVTANADGSLGYQIEGDLPRAQASTSMCVRAKLTNVQLFDARQPGTPRAALLGGKFDRNVYELEAKGTRTMLVADTFMGSDPSRRGNTLVVFGNAASRSGSLTTNTSKGPQLLAVMGDVDYTPEALRRLSADTKVAMNLSR